MVKCLSFINTGCKFNVREIPGYRKRFYILLWHHVSNLYLMKPGCSKL